MSMVQRKPAYVCGFSHGQPGPPLYLVPRLWVAHVAGAIALLGPAKLLQLPVCPHLWA